jgi:hypothetical protein
LYIKIVVNESSEPVFVFLGLVELESQNADGIINAIENLPFNAAFTHEWLSLNWIGFISDSASVLVGKKKKME